MFAYAVMTLNENPYETGAYISNFYATYNEALREACEYLEEDVEYVFGDKYPIGKVAESTRIMRHGDHVTEINVGYDGLEINCAIFSPNDLPICI